MSYEARVTELGITLPGPFPPHDPLDPVVVHRGTARTSGCLPRDADGRLPATGLLGRDVSADDFVEQPRVADGASRVLERVFGDAGRHTRSAIGVAALPRGAPVEVEVTAALRAGR